jgi:rod shape-determining protein MreC
MLLSKNRVIRRRAVVGLLIAASLTLLTMSYREGSTGVVGSMQRGALEVTGPFSTIAHRVASPFVDGWHWTTGLIHARNQAAELDRLRTQVGLDASRIRQLNERLAAAQQLAHWVEQNPKYTSVSGSVITLTQGGPTSTISIAIGRDQGVSVNDAVIAPTSDGGGLVGRVSAVTSGYSVVTVLLDPQTGVTAEVLGRKGTSGATVVPATGTPGELTMEQVPQAALVRDGDTVITTGIAGGRLRSIYPPGLPIGRVSHVDNSDTSGPNKEIQVTPFVDFGSLTDVLVLETQ